MSDTRRWFLILKALIYQSKTRNASLFSEAFSHESVVRPIVVWIEGNCQTRRLLGPDMATTFAGSSNFAF